MLKIKYSALIIMTICILFLSSITNLVVGNIRFVQLMFSRVNSALVIAKSRTKGFGLSEISARSRSVSRGSSRSLSRRGFRSTTRSSFKSPSHSGFHHTSGDFVSKIELILFVFITAARVVKKIFWKR